MQKSNCFAISKIKCIKAIKTLKCSSIIEENCWLELDIGAVTALTAQWNAVAINNCRTYSDGLLPSHSPFCFCAARVSFFRALFWRKSIAVVKFVADLACEANRKDGKSFTLIWFVIARELIPNGIKSNRSGREILLWILYCFEFIIQKTSPQA